MEKSSSDFKRVSSAVATKRNTFESADYTSVVQNARGRQRLSTAGRHRRNETQHANHFDAQALEQAKS